MEELQVRIDIQENKGKALAKQGEVKAAEMTFSLAGEKLLIIDHTDVEEAFRGKSLGRLLLDQVVDMARREGKKIMPLCPYAKSVFDKDPSIRDVLR